MIMSLEERRIKFQPRTKWNQNIYIVVKKRPIKQLFFKNSRPEGTANSNKHQVQKTKFELNAGSISLRKMLLATVVSYLLQQPEASGF